MICLKKLGRSLPSISEIGMVSAANAASVNETLPSLTLGVFRFRGKLCLFFVSLYRTDACLPFDLRWLAEIHICNDRILRFILNFDSLMYRSAGQTPVILYIYVYM